MITPPFSRINVVLVRPIYPRNVGMCSRAMANIGAGRLIIIGAKFDHQTHEARQGAANGQRPLEEATIYPSIEAFYEKEGSGVRIALTGKDNRLRSPEMLDAKLESLIFSENKILADQRDAESRDLFDIASPIYLFFGQEDDGLSVEDMKWCHHLCSLPVSGEISSLNISHAVLLTLHIVSSFLKRIHAFDTAPSSTTPLSKAYYPEKTIDAWLEALGFSLDQPKVNVALTLHRMLLENQPREDDLRLLETILQQNIRKLKESKGK